MPADPSPEELAAIVAAVEVAWPRPVMAVPALPPPGPDPWRFSGRWWSPRHTTDRQRPSVAVPT